MLPQTIAERVRADVDEVTGLVPGPPIAPVEVRAPSDAAVARSAFDVDRLLAGTASFAAASLAALPRSWAQRTPIDLVHLLAWCTSTVLVDGEPVPAWAPLSGEYDTADGRRLQLHCNFPHHAAGVAHHLGLGDPTDLDRGRLADAIGRRVGEELESELIELGMIPALVRTLEEWDRHPHAVATRELPLVTVERLGDAPPGAALGRPGDGTGISVLDSTRVLAGPVAGHLLASAGCDVLRVGAAHLPTVDVGVLSTGFGKRNTNVDLRTPAGRAAMSELLAGADVWIEGFRPSAIEALGFGASHAASLRPGIVVVQINAFESSADVDPTIAPWADRRGYDSIVQSTTGVRWAGGDHAVDTDGRPLDGAGTAVPRGLPVQALDHATGFLAAGVAARLVAHQREVGGSWLARLSLLRTRNRLVGFGPPTDYRPGAPRVPERLLDTVEPPAVADASARRVTAVRPFLGRWAGPPLPLGSAPPRW